MGLRLSEGLEPRAASAAVGEPAETNDGGLKLKGASELRSARPPARQLPQRVTESLLQADVNLQGLNEPVVVLRSEDGAIFLASEDLERWRLRVPDAAPFQHDGKPFYRVSDLQGVAVEVNERKQTLALTAAPQAFANTAGAINQRRFPPPVLPQPGGFFNYTLSGTHTTDRSLVNGLFEAGFFSKYGVLTSTALSPDLGRTTGWVRLDTTYAIDHPENMTSIRLGDTITRAGTWGRAVRIGGVQDSTNFATQPGFIRQPVLQAAGAAALPSVLDVYVNNALVQRRDIPPGPFSIQNIPAVTGSGDVRLVVRDLLGREQIITQPFYSSASLLKAGLSDWSYEAGLIRNDFSVASNSYGPAAASATYRRGVTDSFTGELRGETTPDLQALGASATAQAGTFGVLTLTAATSHSGAGAGQLVGVGVEHLTSTLSVAAQTQITTPRFRQMGMADGELPRTRQTFGTITYGFGALGAFSLAYSMQVFRDQPQIQTTTLSYGVPVFRRANLSISLLRTESAVSSTGAFATLTIPLGESTSLAATYERTKDSSSGVANTATTIVAQKSVPLGDGYGYRAQWRNDDLLGSVTLQNSVGTYTLEASQPKDGGSAQRLSVTGGIGMAGGHAFMSRTLTDSFGVVRVADFSDVKVLQDNQVVARTDDNGYAVLPRLRPYDRNQVSLDQNDLPFDARVGSLRIEAVPYYRTGILFDFPVRRVRAATLHVVLEDGTPLPSGALAHFEESKDEFPVALRGEAYLEGFSDQNRIVFTWKGRSCTLDVSYPRTKDPLPELGTFTCKGVLP